MAAQPVEAVFFFRYTKQVFQACYARISSSTRYTKNYIQVTGAAAPAMDQTFHRTGDSDIDVEFVWPSGSENGGLRPHRGDPSGSAHRVQLYWRQSGHAPKPWKLGPLTDPDVTIPGDPSYTDPDDADAEREALEQANLGPWLIGVKLDNDEGRLHVRAYLERPPAGHQHTDVGVLPSQLLAAVRALPAGAQSGVFLPGASAAPTPRAAKIVSAVLEALDRDPNVLLVGPPGTGKTVALEDLRELAEHQTSTLMFDPDRWHDAFSTGSENKVVSLVFHPSYTYENFVAGLVPETDDDGHLRLVAKPGPLLALAHWAGSSPRRALIIIDEFNRGPTAAIFGDTLALLDGTKRQDISNDRPGAHIARPYAGTSMLVAPEYADINGERNVPDEFRLPLGVQLVAALNSSDRSVAPLDAALRRRFAILAVQPNLEALADHLGIPPLTAADVFTPAAPDPEDWIDDDVKRLALHLLRTLNARIDAVLGADFLLGHALLWPVGDSATGSLRSALCQAFDQRIVASLRMTFSDQDDLLAAVLGAGSADNAPLGPRVAVWRQPPEAVAAVALPYLELHSAAGMAWAEAATSLRAVLAPD